MFRFKKIAASAVGLTVILGSLLQTSVASANAYDYLPGFVLLDSMQNQMKSVHSFRYEGLVDVSDMAETTRTTGLRMDGAYVRNDADPLLPSQEMKLTVLFDGSSPDEFQGLMLRAIDKEAFVKLAGSLFGQYNGQWISISEEDIKSYMESQGLTGTEMDRLSLSLKLTPQEQLEAQEELMAAFVKAGIINWGYVTDGEMVDVIETYKIPFTVDLVAAVDFFQAQFIKEMEKAKEEMKANMDETGLTEDDIDAMLTYQPLSREEIAQEIEASGLNVSISGSLNIGVYDLLLHKADVAVSMADPAMPEDKYFASLTVRLSDFNAPISIARPENAVPFSQLMSDYTTPLAPEMSYDDSYYGDGEYAGESIDTDGDGLSDESESFYGTNPTLSDTDGDGYDDLTEIVNGYNPNGPGAMDESMNYDY